MLTLEEAIHDQNDLYTLCNDRALETNELFKPNSYYGIDSIIKEYCSFPKNKPLKIIFPHGIYLDNNFVWDVERKSIIPCIYIHSLYRYKLYREKTNKIILQTASPFVYLSKMMKKESKHKRNGTIFFLSHSTHHVTAISNQEKILSNIEKLDAKYKPFSICIYWKDFLLGRHKIFEKNGYRIVTAGHMYDPFFLHRLYHLCSMHKYSASNELGTHLFYSVKAGCSFFFMEYGNPYWEASINVLQRDAPTLDTNISKNFFDVFSNPLDEPTTEQMKMVNEFLGTCYLRSPDELRAELDFADRIDKFGISRHPFTNNIHYRLPNLIPRTLLRNFKRNINNIISK